MNKAECKRYADERLKDAKVLLECKRWTAAFYLAGYAVECGLKACIWAHIERSGIIFQDKKFMEKCFTHDLEILVMLANLKEARGLAISEDPELGRYWMVVKDWSESSRYETVPHAKAKKLYEAITSRRSGVMRWIKGHW